MSLDEFTEYSQEQERQEKAFRREDRRDPIQEEIDAEEAQIMAQFGQELKHSPVELCESSQKVLKNFVSWHTTLDEKKRAYNLAMWILKQAKEKT